MAKRKAARSTYGDGTIYQLANGRYKVEVRLKPGEKPTVRRAATREAAEAIRTELLALRSSGVRVDMALEAFEVYANWWYTDVWLQSDPAPRSRAHTRDMIEWYILPTIGRAILSTIQHDQLQSLLNNLRVIRGARKGQPLAPRTKGHVRRILRQMFKKALKANYITHDPSEDLVVPSIDTTPKEAPTHAHVRALLATVEGHPHALAYHIMATLGTRLGETLALRRTDFDGDFTEVKIETAVSYHTLDIGEPKRGSRRPLPVPPHLSALCRAQWQRVKLLREDEPGFNPLGYLMPSDAGTLIQPSNFEKAWNGYTQRRETKRAGRKAYQHTGFRDRAGWPAEFTIHSLRAYVATTLEECDTPQRTISHILGHGAKNVTEKYIRRSMLGMRRALERLEAALWEDAEARTETG